VVLTLVLALAGDRSDSLPLNVRPTTRAPSLLPARWCCASAGRSAGRCCRLTHGRPRRADRPAQAGDALHHHPASRIPGVTGRALPSDQRFTFTTRPTRLVLSRPEAADADVLAPRR